MSWSEKRESVDLSPTVKAARLLSDLLPDENDTALYGGESCHFFHFQTNDYCVLERTVRLALRYGDLKEPWFMSIERFSDFLLSGKSDSAKSRKSAPRGYDFSRVKEHEAFLDGNQLVVWSAFTQIYPEHVNELQYGRLLSEFLQFCEAERAGHLDRLSRGLDPGEEDPVCKRVIFVTYGPQCPMPELLRNSMRVIRYDSLQAEDFRILLREHWERNRERIDRELGHSRGLVPRDAAPTYDDGLLNWYANYMAGIPEMSVRRLLSEMRRDFPGGIVDFKARDKIASRVARHKNETLRIHDRLEVKDGGKYDASGRGGKPGGGGIEGLDAVTNWLNEHKAVSRESGLAPNGILLVGIPGSGKSATAKLAARILELPLVKLDMSKVLGGRVGDSEKGMREMLSDLEYAAPCVLWIDEVEKAMSGADGKSDGSGVIQRLFGMLLEFMQENDKPVFTVTTANDISKLPPEFFRNGRFNQTFCVMMPEYRGCCDIMRSKLETWMEAFGWDVPERTEMKEYAKRAFDACVGTKDDPRFLTGADIEAHVKELFCAYAADGPDRRPTVSRLAEDMRKAACTTRAQAPAASLSAMRDIASRYLDMLQRGLRMAGSGSTPFATENLALDRVRFYKYVEGEDLPECVIHPDPDAYRRALKSEKPEEWYDAVFFKRLVGCMNELVIYDRELTPDETRQAYYSMKTAKRY